MAGKIQNEDIKSAAELVAAGATAASMPNDDKIWVKALGLNKSLNAAIVAGDFSSAGNNGGFTPVHVTGASQTIAVGKSYNADNAGGVAFALPATAALGTRFAIVGVGAGGWNISQAAGQYIVVDFRSSSVGTGGSISSGSYSSCIEVECTLADLGFTVVNSQGGINVSGWLFQGMTYSYFMGSQAGRTAIDRLVYAGETIAAIAGTLATGRGRGSGGVSTLKGYDLGGEDGPGNPQTQISDLTWATQGVASNANSLTTLRSLTAGCSQSAKAYTAGGTTNAGETTFTNSIEALTYSGETVATLGSVISQARTFGDSSFSAPTKGYFCGGSTTGGISTATSSAIEGFVFSGETCGAISATLSANRVRSGALSSTSAGYVCCGINGAGSTLSSIEKLTFGGEVRTTLGTSLAAALLDNYGSSSTVKGYSAGGVSSSTNAVQALTFATETAATLAAVVTASTGGMVGVQV